MSESLSFTEGLLPRDGVYLTPQGKAAIRHNWDEGGSFSEGLAQVVRKTEFEGRKNTGMPQMWEFGKWGFIDRTGKLVIPAAWDGCEAFREGLAVVSRNTARNGKTADELGRPFTMSGFIDKAGKVVIPPQWDLCGSFHDGLACVVSGGKFGFIDKTGKVVIPLVWDAEGRPRHRLSHFSEGLAAVRRDGKSGFIDKTGVVVIPIEWGNVEPFSEGLALVERSGPSRDTPAQCFIDRAGKVVIEGELRASYQSFSEGLAVVSKDRLSGFIDKTGKVVISPQWDYCKSFSDGMAVVGKDKKNGYIDREGTLVIPHQWDWTYRDVSFSGGFAVPGREIIDKKGKVMFTYVPPERGGQPKDPPDTGVAAPKVPTWTSLDGVTIEGEFVRVEGEVVVIRRGGTELHDTVWQTFSGQRESGEAAGREVSMRSGRAGGRCRRAFAGAGGNPD
jgi:hypothetical protein